MSPTAFLLRHAVFTTRLFAALTGTQVASASRRLVRWAEQGDVVRLTRGVWAQPQHPAWTPAAAVGHLLGKEQGYVSFISALHLQGVLAQIPAPTTVATTGHGRTLHSPVGRYEFFKLDPRMMRDGIGMSNTTPPYPLAEAEKALLDAFYIPTRRGRRFASLPELAVEELDRTRLGDLLRRQVSAKPLRVAIERRIEEVWRAASAAAA